MKHLAEVASEYRRELMQPCLPAHQLRPAVRVKRHAPRHHLVAALTQLITRERTREQLAEMLQTRYPAEPVYVDDIVVRLIGQGHLLEVDGQLGLTEAGTQMAQLLKRDAARTSAAAAADMSEEQRRTAVLAEGLDTVLLASGAARQPTSRADHAEAPQRPGAQDHHWLPSRIGNRYHYRDGRVTELDGTVVWP